MKTTKGEDGRKHQKLFVLGFLLILTLIKDITPAVADSDDSWRTRAPMPTPRENLAAAAVGGRLYAIGGENNNGSLATVEEYDPTINSWRTRAPMPTPRYDLAAVAVGGKIYAFSGYTRETTVEEYDPTTNSWRSRASMPTARIRFAATAVNGRIYIIGGYKRAGSITSIVEEYDPATNSWRSCASMPTKRVNPAAVTVGGQIYVLGGSYIDFIGAPKYPSTVEVYDPTTNRWRSHLAPIPSGRVNFAAAAVGGRIYAVGCGTYEGYLVHGADVEEYNPATNSWKSRRSMPTRRHSLTVALVGGRLYAIGGWDYGCLSTVEEYDPPFFDTDDDGLADDNELGRYGTDPLVPDADADTDGDGLTNVEEVDTYGTKFTSADTDGDGLADGEEVATHSTNPTSADTDRDGLEDDEEVATHNTNPTSADTDGDGLLDGFEVSRYGTDPLVPDAETDTDGDRLTNVEEVDTYGTNTNSIDTDGDGLLDGDEVLRYHTNPTVSDADGDTDEDGLPNVAEMDTYGTNPTFSDTDGDGLTDGEEIFRYHTNPTRSDVAVDTDGDGLPNVEEVDVYHTNPQVPDAAVDTDGDKLSNVEEVDRHGTNPVLADTDGDGVSDGKELGQGTNPLNRDSDRDLFGDASDPLPTVNNFFIILPGLGLLATLRGALRIWSNKQTQLRDILRKILSVSKTTNLELLASEMGLSETRIKKMLTADESLLSSRILSRHGEIFTPKTFRSRLAELCYLKTAMTVEQLAREVGVPLQTVNDHLPSLVRLRKRAVSQVEDGRFLVSRTFISSLIKKAKQPSGVQKVRLSALTGVIGHGFFIRAFLDQEVDPKPLFTEFDEINNWTKELLKIYAETGHYPRKSDMWAMGIPIDRVDTTIALANSKISFDLSDLSMEELDKLDRLSLRVCAFLETNPSANVAQLVAELDLSPAEAKLVSVFIEKVLSVNFMPVPDSLNTFFTLKKDDKSNRSGGRRKR